MACSGSSSLSVVSKSVTKQEKQTLAVHCHYDQYYRSYVKYWCKGDNWHYCSSLKRTDSPETPGDKITISDDQTRGVFTVTMRGLEKEDAGWYWCAIEKLWSDLGISLNLTVVDAPIKVAAPRKKTTTTISTTTTTTRKHTSTKQATLTLANQTGITANSGEESSAWEFWTVWAVLRWLLCAALLGSAALVPWGFHSKEGSKSHTCNWGQAVLNSEMKFRFLLLLATLQGAGASKVWLNTIDGINGDKGGSVSVQCHYDRYFITNVKYWCRGKVWHSCKVIQRSHEKQREEDKVSISDNRTQRVFTVTVRRLEKKDADWYWCGIERVGIDEGTLLNLKVADATAVSTVKPSSNPPSSNSPADTQKQPGSKIVILTATCGVLLILMVTITLCIRKTKSKEGGGKKKGSETNISPSGEQEGDVTYTTVSFQKGKASQGLDRPPCDSVTYASLAF
ncbi:polymeric immunoglobulin receptor-like [Acipenser ruthenus]|uniref:polymeric immunoglobulin receptor-like n=1 Tax=Acipenser ruthenus TaxID=7906 RepID=UPI0027417322|nr:polymeric immunoglobulin receptor-like [Acipenser ruthenus]